MSHIWVPKFKILEGEVAQPPQKLRGFFTMTRRKADTLEEIQTVGPFENLITNYGLNLIGTTAPSHIAVGAGTGTPSASDTNLQSLVAYSATEQGSEVRMNANWPTVQYASFSATRRFAAGVAAGNLSEVGVGHLSGSPSIFYTYSRARIVDGGGTPATITVLSDEVLDVTYELRHYLYPWEDSSDDVDTILTLSGVDYDIKMRPLGVNGSDWTCAWRSAAAVPGLFFYTGTAAGTPPTLAAITAAAMDTPGFGESAAPAEVPYVSSSLTRSGTVSAGLDSLNLAYGLRGMDITTNVPGVGAYAHLAARWQATITPAIPKDATKVLSFGLSYSWARHTP